MRRLPLIAPRSPSPSRTPFTLTTTHHVRQHHSYSPAIKTRPRCCAARVCLRLHARHYLSRPSFHIRTSHPARFPNPGLHPPVASHVHPRPVRYLRIFFIQLVMFEVQAGQGGCASAPFLGNAVFIIVLWSSLFVFVHLSACTCVFFALPSGPRPIANSALSRPVTRCTTLHHPHIHRNATIT